MIIIKRKEDCCGCSACMAACPVNVIKMASDDEGFYYPKIDKDKCIQCGKCDSVCPIKNNNMEIVKEQKAFLFQLRNKNLRMDSTSGGAFTAIAAAILREGGVVFGAAYDDAFNVVHRYVETEAELWRFRNSKYVQSDVKNSFRQVKNFLRAGRKVCFSGTPCQIEGLHNYLGEIKQRENLLLVDMVCRAIPSPLFWKKYITWQQKNTGKKIGNIRFRDKRHYGYKYSQMVIEDKNGNIIYHKGVESDPYLRAFFSNLSDRPSCYECKFKKRYRVSDITLWDCFDVGLKNFDLDDDIGTTNVLLHSELGKIVLRKINTDKILPISADKCVNGMREMICPVKKNKARTIFMNNIRSMDMSEIIKIWFPDNIKTKVNRCLRICIIKLGLYGALKKCLVITKRFLV